MLKISPKALHALATGTVHAAPPDLQAVKKALDAHKITANPPIAPTLASILHKQGLTPRPVTAKLEKAAKLKIPEGALTTRRETAAILPVDIGLPVATGSPLAVSKTLGPFPGVAGQFWLDLHLPATTLQIYHSSFDQPFLVVTRGKLPLSGSKKSIPLDGGTVWILARSLSARATAGTYVGFTVSSGQIELPRAPRVSHDKITLSGSLDLTLSTVPHDSRSARISSNAAAATTPPAKAMLKWTNGAVKATVGNGSARCYGERIDFKKAATTFEWQSDISSITLSFADAAPDGFDVKSIRSKILKAHGKAKIAAAWLLPGYHPADTHHWSEAAGPGWWSLELAQPVTARWSGAPEAATLSHARVLINRDQFWLFDRGANGKRMNYRISLWSEHSGRVPLDLNFESSFRFAFGSGAAARDSVTVGCLPACNNPRPLTVAGTPLAAGSLEHGVIVLGVTGDSSPSIHVAGARSAASTRHAIGLRNALLTVSDPAGVSMEGTTRNGRDVNSGTLRVLLPCFDWLPTLPDPYVSNMRAGTPANSARPIEFDLVWTKTGKPPEVSFHGALDTPGGNLGRDSLPGPSAAATDQSSQIQQVRVPTQITQGRAHPIVLAPPVLTHGNLKKSPDIAQSIKQTAAAEAKFAKSFKTVPPGTNGVRLLDVSGAKDLIGVGLGLSTTQGDVTFKLDGDSVKTSLDNVSAMMLPQVQWEPVHTLEVDESSDQPFPKRLDFTDDGGPTSLTVDTPTLVASVPELVVKAVIDANSKSPPTPVKVVTTLPFGLAARFELKTRGGNKRDQIELVTPSFNENSLTGAHQLKLTAGAPHQPPQSNAFEKIGTESQGLHQKQGIATSPPPLPSGSGGPLPPDVFRIFNRNLADLVPVTRLDLSGYGESCFSDWSNPKQLPAIGKVQFQVLVGRTALEIVKAVSVLYPWGIEVTRTVTIERRGGGGVIRRDSGWQASSDGVFRFPLDADATSDTPSDHYLIDVEPGVLRGLSDVHNIRDTGGAPLQFPSDSTNVSLVPVLFDAKAKLSDGSDQAITTDAEAVLGLLQVLPTDRRLTTTELTTALGTLIDPNTGDSGAVGGRIDADLNLAGSGFKFRARRIEVACRSGSVPALVGVARGTPVFRQAGSWGVARRSLSASGEVTEATSVEEARGTPLVVIGKLDPNNPNTTDIKIKSDRATPPVGTFLFRDPDDVHKQPDEMRHEYGFLQSSPAHAFFFPDPHVKGHNATSITSPSPPEFADAFLRTTSKGVFPSKAQSLALPALGLAIGDHGSLTPNPSILNWSPGALSRPLMKNGTRHIDYGSAKLSLNFGPTSWSVGLPGLSLGSDVMGITNALTFSGDIHAGTNRRAILENLNSGFGGSLKDNLGKFAKWFSPPNKPQDIDLAATNAGVEGILKYGFNIDLDLDVIELGLDVQACYDAFNTSASLNPPGISFGLEIEGKIDYELIELLIGASFEYEQTGSGENNFEVRAFVGFEAGLDKPPVFKLVYTCKLGAVITIDSGALGLGFFLDESLELEILPVAPIIYVKAELELTCLWQLNVHDYHKDSDPSGWQYVYDDEHGTTLTELGKKIGNAYVAPTPSKPNVPTTYFIGEGKFMVHASVLFLLSVSFEFDYIFACAS